MRSRRRETGLHQTPAVESAADDPIKVAMDAAVEVMSVTVDVLVAISRSRVCGVRALRRSRGRTRSTRRASRDCRTKQSSVRRPVSQLHECAAQSDYEQDTQ